MKRDNIEQYISEDWFKNHIAEFENIGKVSILRWGVPGSNFYRVRYVFDYNKIYITGDIGDAIFKIYDEITLEKASNLDINYFHKKLTAMDNEKWSFNSELAINYLKDKIKELESDKCEWLGLEQYDPAEEENFTDDQWRKVEEYNNYISTMNNLIELADRCSTVDNWRAGIYIDHLEELEEYDTEYYEWIFNIGNEIPSRVQAYLIGLQMALEQLKKTENPELLEG